MAEFSFPWTAVSGDRTITSAQQQAMNAAMVANGALKAFAGSVAGTTLSVTAGAAMINGAYYDVGTATITRSLSGVGGATAYVYLRYDTTARSISLLVSATAAPTRTGGVWDLPIATIPYAGSWGQPVFGYEWALLTGGDPVGKYGSFDGAIAPVGWLACDGSAVSRTTYARLFAAIGTTHGAGDGSTTFNLPDARGRVIAGYNAADANFNAIGKTGGEAAHALAATEMPSHNHALTTSGGTAAMVHNTGNYVANGNGAATYPGGCATGPAGGGATHNNLQPYLVGLLCIRA
jgi:microcystin-dependent protein